MLVVRPVRAGKARVSVAPSARHCRGFRTTETAPVLRLYRLYGKSLFGFEFQVIFTLPDRFSPLILGNRRELYDLLFRSAWRSLDEVLRQEGKFHPVALMVLHT